MNCVLIHKNQFHNHQILRNVFWAFLPIFLCGATVFILTKRKASKYYIFHKESNIEFTLKSIASLGSIYLCEFADDYPILRYAYLIIAIIFIICLYYQIIMYKIAKIADLDLSMNQADVDYIASDVGSNEL